MAVLLRTRRSKVLAGAAGCAALGFAALYVHSQALQKQKQRKSRKALATKKDGVDGKGKSAAGGGRRKKGKGNHKVLAFLLKGSVHTVAALAGLACARTALQNRLSTLQGGLFKTAFLRQKGSFARNLGENFLGCLLLSYIQSHFHKLVQSLELDWRSRLTGGLHDRYFATMNYYKCAHVDKSCTNPEQRICEDVPKYCSGMAQCTGEAVMSIVDILFYSQRLSSYTRTHAYTGAMCLYIFGAGTLTKLVSPNFAKMYKKKQSLEGSYRLSQSRLRSNSESVAFYRQGIEVEAKTMREKLARMLKHNSSVLFSTWKFSMVQDFVLKYFGATVAVILIIGPFFEGHLRPKENLLGRAEMLSNMRYHTGVVISLFTALGTLGSMPSKTSKLKAYAQRIGELQEAMKRGSLPPAPAASGSSEPAPRRGRASSYKGALIQDSPPRETKADKSSSSSIVFENATVSTPAGHTLIRDLNLVIEEGTNLLVTGPNGAGKSSLFRVLGGLWKLEKGKVHKPTRGGSDKDEGLASDIFYVPQKPYVSVGSLIEQLIYPSTLENDHKLVDDPKRLRHLLQQVDLLYLLTDCGRYSGSEEGGATSSGEDISVSSKSSDKASPGEEDAALFDAASTVVNWTEVLSLGEQQRLGMARLFYHSPRFAILDECTSGVTNDMEERFCEIVERMGCTCITISHRPALVAFHDKVLHLDGEGGWSLRDLEHSSSSPSSAGEEEEEVSESFADEDDESRSGSSEEEGPGDYRKMASDKVLEGMTNSMKKAMKEKKRKGSLDHQKAAGSQIIDSHYVKHAGSKSSVSFANLEELGKAGKEAAASSQGSGSLLKLVRRLLTSSRAVGKRRGTLMSSIESSDAVGLSALAACVVLRTAISDRIANLNGQTVYHIINQDRPGFYKLMVTSVFQSAANAVVASSLKYLTDHLALGWRERLTNQLLSYYFKDDRFYQSVHIQHLRDVDQRLTRDVERWCDDLAALLPCAIKPVLDAGWFSWRCYKLTGAKGISFLYLYMVLGYTTLKAISPDLAFAARREHELESAFRQSHIALRERAESVAFFGGGHREKQCIHKRFVGLRKHIGSVLSLRFNRDFYENFLTSQLPHNVTWIISMIFSLQYPINIVTDVKNQAAMVKDMRYLATVITQTFVSFGDILGLHKRFTELAGGAERVMECFNKFEAERNLEGMGALVEGGGATMRLENVLVETPGGSKLAENLSLTLSKESGSLIISGPNGSGKTSLLRVMANLWPPKQGTITVPRIFFVTQKTYLTEGSLMAQIVYPHSVEWGEARVGGKQALEDCCSELLASVRLSYLLERWGLDQAESQDWSQTLSLGEQQRLCMARGFFHCRNAEIHFLVLDEATNAVSLDVEEDLYDMARDLGITLVTVTQRAGLMEHHSQELRLLDGNGSWEHLLLGNK